MSYTDYLLRLLAPLGIYDLREDSVSGAVAAAFGEALEEVWTLLQRNLADAFPQRAEGEALSRWERLLRLPYRAASAAGRQAVVTYLLSRPEVDCFASSILGALAVCGLEGTVDLVTDAPRIAVTLSPHDLTEQELALAQQFAARFAPAHRKLSWHAAQ